MKLLVVPMDEVSTMRLMKYNYKLGANILPRIKGDWNLDYTVECDYRVWRFKVNRLRRWYGWPLVG